MAPGHTERGQYTALISLKVISEILLKNLKWHNWELDEFLNPGILKPLCSSCEFDAHWEVSVTSRPALTGREEYSIKCSLLWNWSLKFSCSGLGKTGKEQTLPFTRINHINCSELFSEFSCVFLDGNCLEVNDSFFKYFHYSKVLDKYLLD